MSRIAPTVSDKFYVSGKFNHDEDGTGIYD